VHASPDAVRAAAVEEVAHARRKRAVIVIATTYFM
jgi:hypothetical protein